MKRHFYFLIIAITVTAACSSTQKPGSSSATGDSRWSSLVESCLAGDCAAIPKPNSGARNLKFLTDIEREVLLEINMVRAHPREYADYLGTTIAHYHGKNYMVPGKITIRTIEGAEPVWDAIEYLKTRESLPPLLASPGMSRAAQDHVADQSRSGATGHYGRDGSSPADRMRRHGRWDMAAGENINYGYNNARDIVRSLIVDDGVPDRGHRKAIFQKLFGVAGVSCGSHPKYRYLCVVDFAGAFTEK
ncbi:MAG: CAP domain-containing protein [Spirochaetes bacterium]|nr:CAP domain-containing protein [Spirochaetota bacterium]